VWGWFHYYFFFLIAPLNFQFPSLFFRRYVAVFPFRTLKAAPFFQLSVPPSLLHPFSLLRNFFPFPLEGRIQSPLLPWTRGDRHHNGQQPRVRSRLSALAFFPLFPFLLASFLRMRGSASPPDTAVFLTSFWRASSGFFMLDLEPAPSP